GAEQECRLRHSCSAPKDRQAREPRAPPALLRRRLLLRGALDELQDRALAVVAETVLAELEDTAVAAAARLEARTEDGEELLRGLLAAHLGKDAPAVVLGRLLAERDESLDERLDVLRARHGRHDALVLDQRDGHVARHRRAVAARPAELLACFA